MESIQMKIFTAILIASILSGCSSMGTRGIDVSVTKDGAQVEYRSGTEIAEGFKGQVFVSCQPSGVCMAYLSGEGGAVDPTAGHEATKEIITEGIKAGIAGAKMGFAP